MPAIPVVYRNGFGYKDLSQEECRKYDKNPKSIWPGIGIKDGARALIRKNKSYGNAVCGISVDNNAFALIEANEVYGNQYPGIGVGGHHAAQAIIRSNRVYANAGPGIGVNIASSPVIVGNTIEKNGDSMPAIAVASGALATVIHNLIKPGSIAGVAVIKATATISGNKIEKALKAGIRADDSVVSIDNNEIIAAGAAGIYLHNSRVTVTRNSVSGCEHHGIIILGKESRANVSANQVAGNGKKGGANIYVGKATAVRLAANKFKDTPPLGDIFSGKSDYGILSQVLSPQEMMKRFRPEPAMLGPGPTENYFNSGKEDHEHDETEHDH